MNPDVGDVLRRAWQITWRHRALWILSALPLLLFVLYLPWVFYFFLAGDVAGRIPGLPGDPGFVALLFLVIVLSAGLALVLQVFSQSATTFGLVRIEEGQEHPGLRDLFRGGRRFFWRILGVVLLASLGMMAFFTVFSACLALVGVVTFGLGSAVGQLLLLPATLLIYALIEQAQAAIVADGLSPAAAIRHAWQVVREHAGLFVLVTLILYTGLSLVSSLGALPVTAPVFIAVLARFASDPVDPGLVRAAMLTGLACLPLYLIVQAGARLYMKSAFVILYLRLRRNPKLQRLPGTPGSLIIKETQ